MQQSTVTTNATIDFTRISSDVNGNPRYVCHFLNFITDNDNFPDVGVNTTSCKYNLALSRAKELGGRKFHNKQYGGGIVFQCHNTRLLSEQIFTLMQQVKVMADINTIIQEYKVCALWSSEDKSNKLGDCTIHQFDNKANKRINQAVTKFIKDNASDLINSGLTPSEIGHSLWLTQNHHGTGFFDYKIDQEIIDRLTKSAQSIGEWNLYTYAKGKKVGIM